MAKQKEEAAAGGLMPIAARPSYLENVPADTGTKELGRIVRPSFMKKVGKTSSDELLTQFGAGSIILVPDMLLLTPGNEEEHCVVIPLLFYTEYCKWASYKLKGQEPMIVDRTHDPTSPIALKSQSSATWSEPHPKFPEDPDYRYRYVEHLNFIVKLPDFPELDPCLLSFVKTSYAAGQRLGKMILGRKAPIFAGRYALSTRTRENAKGEFKIFTVSNDPTEPWVVDAAEYHILGQQHEFFNDLQKARNLETVYDEENDNIVDAEVESGGTY